MNRLWRVVPSFAPHSTQACGKDPIMRRGSQLLVLVVVLLLAALVVLPQLAAAASTPGPAALPPPALLPLVGSGLQSNPSAREKCWGWWMPMRPSTVLARAANAAATAAAGDSTSSSAACGRGRGRGGRSTTARLNTSYLPHARGGGGGMQTDPGPDADRQAWQARQAGTHPTMPTTGPGAP